MKKTYINPTLKEIKMKRVNLLTLSGDGLRMSISNTGAESAAEGRDFDFEDEEY